MVVIGTTIIAITIIVTIDQRNTVMTKSIRNTLLAAAAIGSLSQAALAQPATTAQPAKNVVLVHGAFADGSGWRGGL